MPTTTKSIKTTDLQTVISEYEETDTTTALYGLGSMLLAECMDRAKQLDARAMALSGYAAVTTALLVTIFVPRMREMPWWSAVFISSAGVSLVASTVLAFSALWIREYQWFSDNDWFRSSLFENPDGLRRAHVLAMHQYRAKHEVVNSRKALILLLAYSSLMVCGVLLALGLVATRL